MSAAIDLTIDSDLSRVHEAASVLRASCSESYGSDFVDSLEIALVEAINNVIEHGYGGQQGGDIGVRFDLHADKAVIEISDHAPPMPADAAADVDPFGFDPDDLSALPEGGMGLALIRANMDKIEYLPSATGNLLRMTKYNNPASGSPQVT